MNLLKNQNQILNPERIAEINKNNQILPIMKEVFNYGAEHFKSKESHKNNIKKSKDRIASPGKQKFNAAERYEIRESIKNLKNAISKQKSNGNSPSSNLGNKEPRSKSLIQNPLNKQAVGKMKQSREGLKREQDASSPHGQSDLVSFIEDISQDPNKEINKSINSKPKIQSIRRKLSSIPLTYINSPVNASQNVQLPPLSTKNAPNRHISNPHSRKHSDLKNVEKQIKESPIIAEKHLRNLSNHNQSEQVKSELMKDISRSNLFRNQNKRYSNRFGVNLQSYKVNVYNIGINANIGSILSTKDKHINNLRNREQQHKSGKRKRLPYPKNYFEVISRSVVQDHDFNNHNSQVQFE